MLAINWDIRLFSFAAIIAVASLWGCATDRGGNTPLIRAAFYGDAPKVEALLKAGEDVNAANRLGITPLLASAWGGTGKGDVHIARVLIESGANVNATTIRGETTLIAVSIFGNVESALLLLDNGADVNAQDVDGDTALHQAALHGHTAIVRALLAKGAKPNVADSHGTTPLMWACDCPSPEGVCPERAEIVRLLIAGGADVNMKDARGNTALHRIQGGTRAEKEEVKLLLKDAGAKE